MNKTIITSILTLVTIFLLSSCSGRASKSEQESMTQNLFETLQQEYSSPTNANIRMTKYAYDRHWDERPHNIEFIYSYNSNDTLVEIVGYAIFSKELNVVRQVDQQCIYVTDVILDGQLLPDSIAEYSKYLPRHVVDNTLNFYYMHHKDPNSKSSVNYMSNDAYCAQLKSNGAADALITDDGYLQYGAKHGQITGDPDEVAKLWYEDAVASGVVGLKGCFIILLPEEKIIGTYKKHK